MSWLVTFASSLVGMILGGAGMFAIAHACVQWYRISSFEGQSGYFIVGLTLLGAIGGFLVALIAARIACVWLGQQWYNQTGFALAMVVVALVFTLVLCYLGIDRARG